MILEVQQCSVVLLGPKSVHLNNDFLRCLSRIFCFGLIQSLQYGSGKVRQSCFTVIYSISSGCILILLWNLVAYRTQPTLVGVIGSGFKVQVFTCQCICGGWHIFHQFSALYDVNVVDRHDKHP